MGDRILGCVINILVVVIPCLGLSVAYFLAGHEKPLHIRVLKSSHGALLLIAFVYAHRASRMTSIGDYGYWMIPLTLLVILAAASAILSLFSYINWRWHFLYLIGVPIGFLVWLTGLLMIGHDSI